MKRSIRRHTGLPIVLALLVWIAITGIAMVGWYNARAKVDRLAQRTCMIEMSVQRIVNGKPEPIEKFHSLPGAVTVRGSITNNLFIEAKVTATLPEEK